MNNVNNGDNDVANDDGDHDDVANNDGDHGDTDNHISDNHDEASWEKATRVFFSRVQRTPPPMRIDVSSYRLRFAPLRQIICCFNA